MLSDTLNVIALLALAGVGVFFVISSQWLGQRRGLRRALLGVVLGSVAALMSVLSLPPDTVKYLPSIVGPLIMGGFIAGFGGAIGATVVSALPALLGDGAWQAIPQHGLAAGLGAGLSYALFGTKCVEFSARVLAAVLALSATVILALHVLPTAAAENMSFHLCLVFALGSTLITYGMLMLAVRGARNLRSLAEFETRMKMAAEVAQIGTWDWEIGNDICAWDNGMHQIYGTDPDGPPVTHRSFLNLVHGDDRHRVLNNAEARAIGGAPQHFEFRAFRSDGTLLTIHSALKNQYDNAGNLARVSGLHMDVTNLRRAEAQRGEAEMRLRNIIETVPGALLTYLFTPDGKDSATFLNSHCEDLFEVDAHTAKETGSILFTRVHPEDLEALRTKVKESLRTGQIFVNRCRLKLPSGRTRWVEGRGMPRILGENLYEFSSVLIDITDHVRIEKELVAEQDRTRRIERLETVGKLSGGVAHDFNNLLAIIVGNLEILREEVAGDERRLGYVREGLDAAARGADLVRNMLTFAQRARLEPAQQEVPELLDRVYGWIRRILPASIDVSMDTDADTRPLHVDATGADNALINLILNARDAMPHGGRLRIEARNQTISRTDPTVVIGASLSLKAGDYVAISVEDTGEGIAPEDLDRIFEPFYSTREPGQTRGSGLGLSTVLGFMEQSGGGVGIRTAPGQGTRVTLFFPALRAGNTATRPPPVRPSPKQTPSSSRVLLAEDEPQVAAVLRRTLELEGYSVCTAPSGDEAVDVFANSGPFDILVTDIVMPGQLQGPDLAAELRRQTPALPVVFLSGYAPETVFEANGILPGDIRMMKPVTRLQLIEAVAQALAKRRARSTARKELASS